MQISSLLGRHVESETGVRSVEQAQRWIDEAVKTARDLSRELRPPALYEGGLAVALRGLANEFEERLQLKVHIEARDGAEAISDDIKALLYQCVRELLFNTAKYAGVNEARVSLWREKKCFRLKVSDRGCGFDAAAIAREVHDIGFGLFSIRERLTALGGDVTIDTAPGKGTRVEMEVPLAPETEEPLPGALAPVETRFTPRLADATDCHIRILVVDDHAMVREGIAAVLNADGRLCVVAQASDGLAAVEAAERHQPDVILMDLNMPRMNGIEATREIRRRWPETIIIGVSVQDDPTTAQSMMGAGAVAFLPKAGDSDKMIAAILEVAPQRSGAQAEPNASLQ